MSGETHQFYRKRVPGDNKCLFWSFIFGIKLLLKDIFGDVSFDKDLMEVINEGLRVLVADYMRSHPELQEEVLLSFPEYETIEEYCSELEQGVLWGGEPELKALSHLFNTIICVINLGIIDKENCLLPLYYGQDNPSASKCIYIYHNGTHYDPLYLVNENNIMETRFDPNNPKVNVCLKAFIRDTFRHRGDIQLGLHTDSHRGEMPKHTNDSNETKIKWSSVPANTPIKRKESGVADIKISSKNDKQLPVSILKKYCDTNKRVKVSHQSPDQASPYYKNIPETMPIDQLIQGGDAPDAASIGNSQANQQQTPDPPIISYDERYEENESDNDTQNNV